jgi:hypothetical protein
VDLPVKSQPFFKINKKSADPEKPETSIGNPKSKVPQVFMWLF